MPQLRLPRTSALLTRAAHAARADRVRFTPPTSWFTQVDDRYAEIWFPTGGCPWDALGHCTTCNYGLPEPVDADAMVAAVEQGLAGIAPTTETLWVSAFDTLNGREVPDDARRRIFSLLGDAPARTVVTEAHPASIRRELVEECRAPLGDRTFAIQLGVETMDEFVRLACVNKPFTDARLARAVEAIRGAGAEAWANLLVGIPFLGRDDVVHGTAASVAQADAMGFSAMVLFPNHVKRHTIAYALAEAGRYAPPDLWVLRDVLGQVPERLRRLVHVAWLELKPHPGAAEVGFAPERSATTALRALLRRFDMERDEDALAEALALEPPDVPSQPRTDPLERMLDDYRWLATQAGDPDWWEANGGALRAELASGLTTSAVGRWRR